MGGGSSCDKGKSSSASYATLTSKKCTYCSAEGQTCRRDSWRISSNRVYYGVSGKFYHKSFGFFSRPDCDNGEFCDPAPGYKKYCMECPNNVDLSDDNPFVLDEPYDDPNGIPVVPVSSPGLRDIDVVLFLAVALVLILNLCCLGRVCSRRRKGRGVVAYDKVRAVESADEVGLNGAEL